MSALASQWGGDPLDSPENSRSMAEKIHAHGGVVEERTYRGVGHLTLIGAFAPAFASSGASAARGHSIRLERHTAGRLLQT
jgi:hypothetical protein